MRVSSPFERREDAPDGVWVVRSITGSSSTKVYRCPGCDQQIRPATPHVVAWPEDDLDARRHWHSGCWRSRAQRRTRTPRSSRGPRY
ncbi:MAG TPA: hypothetical protein VJ649_01360 [Actinomycetes bacterium]|nr:hypothetical protein [Actinomycetes bacterium]